MKRRGVKRKPVPKEKPNPFDKHFTWMGVVSVILLVMAIGYVMYYLYIVIVTGDTPDSGVFTALTDFIGRVLWLFVVNTT